jgi:hypothetical protein
MRHVDDKIDQVMMWGLLQQDLPPAKESIMKIVYLILWPSFLVAGIAEILFFTFVDPRELYLLGYPVTLSTIATYSIGFFAFWGICAASSYATRFFQRAGQAINEESLARTAPIA